MNTSSDEGVRENTLNSLLSGRRAGATWVEFDVQVSSLNICFRLRVV